MAEKKNMSTSFSSSSSSSLVYSWGSDIYGRLGHNTEDKSLSHPKQIQSLPDNVKQVSTGSAHSIAVDGEGQVYTWGKCHYGQLGHGEMDEDEHSPRPVESLKGIAISCVVGGDSHVLAVTRDEGRVYTWGLGYYGTLGHGNESSLAIPKRVEGIPHTTRITGGGAGANHSIALTSDGSVYVWGRDHCGQLGLTPTKGGGTHRPTSHKAPVANQFEEPVKMLSACFNHTLVLLASGRVLSFGCNEHGELGRPTSSSGSFIDPAHFKEKVTLVDAGWKHCAAITESRDLYTWGHGAYGRLGLGHSRDIGVPTLVQGLGSVVDVSCGESHTIALDSAGQLWSWGSNHYGKLGLSLEEGSFIERPRPLSFSSPSHLTGVSTGTNHTLAYSIS